MHLSLWFETKFMTASAAAVNASVRKEKKNTSPSPALFRSGKQSPRRRKRSKRMPYSALFPGPAPPEQGDYIKWPVPPPGAALPGGRTREGKRAASPGPKTCRPPRPGDARRLADRTARRPARRLRAHGGPGKAEGLGKGGGGRLWAVTSAQWS